MQSTDSDKKMPTKQLMGLTRGIGPALPCKCDGQASPSGETRFVADCALPNAHGTFRLRGYRQGGGAKGLEEPTAMIVGDVAGEDVLVRVHDQVGKYGLTKSGCLPKGLV